MMPGKGAGLGSYLRSVRQGEGFTLEALSKRSGYSAGYISSIERGQKVPNPFALRCIVESMCLGHEEKGKIGALLLERVVPCS